MEQPPPPRASLSTFHRTENENGGGRVELLTRYATAVLRDYCVRATCLARALEWVLATGAA